MEDGTAAQRTRHARGPRSGPVRRRAIAAFVTCGLVAAATMSGAAAPPGAARPAHALPSTAVSAAQLAAATLPSEVLAALQAAQVPREALSVVVQEVDAPAPRLAWQPDRLVNPASLMKLVTAYAALELLGPAYAWKTPLWLAGPVREPGPRGVLEGDLVIKGSGDPKLVLENVWLLLRRVEAFGIREIRGDIVLDRSAFRDAPQAPGDFDGEPLRPYNVRPDALLLNHKTVMLRFQPDPEARVARISVEPPLAGVVVDRTVELNSGPCGDWRATLAGDFEDPARLRFTGRYPVICGENVWALAYPDPASYNARLLRALWSELGGRLGGVVRDGAAPADRAPDAEILSPPLAEVVRDINKYSNNTMAQQLFLSLGLVGRGEGSPEAAREVLHDWLASRLGAAADGVLIDNGSGLSRDTRLSAGLLAHLLLQAWSSPVMPELASSLPLAGLDGTMRRSRAAPGRAHLKTGSLRDVAGIAGYVHGEGGRRAVLVAIVNDPNANAARPVLDALVDWSLRQLARAQP